LKSEDLCKKSVSVESILKNVVKDKKLLDDVYSGAHSGKAEIKFKCGKVLRTLSEEKPEIIYPNWDFFIDLLDSDNTFIKAIALAIVANLTRVDSKNKFDSIFNKYYALLDDKSMITAANIAGYSGIIAIAKPKLQTKVTNKLIGIDKTHHSLECKNIIKGKAILTFNEYFEKTKNKKKIIDFVKKQLKCESPKTRKLAREFLNKWEKERS